MISIATEASWNGSQAWECLDWLNRLSLLHCWIQIVCKWICNTLGPWYTGYLAVQVYIFWWLFYKCGCLSNCYSFFCNCVKSLSFPQPGDAYEVVPGSQFVVSRTAYKDNSSHYQLNGHKVPFKEVASLLRGSGIDLDHNRFLILQVRIGDGSKTILIKRVDSY